MNPRCCPLHQWRRSKRLNSINFQCESIFEDAQFEYFFAYYLVICSILLDCIRNLKLIFYVTDFHRFCFLARRNIFSILIPKNGELLQFDFWVSSQVTSLSCPLSAVLLWFRSKQGLMWEASFVRFDIKSVFKSESWEKLITLQFNSKISAH